MSEAFSAIISVSALVLAETIELKGHNMYLFLVWAGDEEAQCRELRRRETVERQLGGDEGEAPDHRGERRQNHVANRYCATAV